MTEGLDTATYVGGLNASEPTGQRKKSTLDNHDRTIKATLLNSFAGFAGQIRVTGTEAQGSTVNDFVVTVSANTAPTTYHNGMSVFFKPNHTNTSSSVTLQINSITAANVLGMRGQALSAGDLTSGYPAEVVYDSGAGVWYLWSPSDRVSRSGDTITGNLAVTGTLSAGATTLSSLAVSGTATAPTPTAGDSSTKIATTAFAAALAMAAALPGQTGHAGQEVVTDGTTASFGMSAYSALALQRMGIW